MTVLFISDLHLDGDWPHGITEFVRFVDTRARHAKALYILGDLFEAWVGDDDTAPAMQPALQALATLHHQGVPCHVMHGNRDFLLGRRFEAATGCQLFGDYETLQLGTERVLLTHGDLLCTDDTAYLGLRQRVRSPAWQHTFLAKPLAERRIVAAELRSRSRSETAGKPDAIMDVNENTVAAVMREHGVHRLLHGHTHRPAVHEFTLDGAPATRMVLGAWHDGANAIRWDADSGFHYETF